jgi:hypothetical protein
MKLFASSLLLVVLAAAAIADDRHIDFDSSVDFATLKTFSVRDGVISTNAPELNHSLTRKRILETVRTELISKGLVEAAANADFVVTYQLMSATGRGVQPRLPGIRGGNRGGVYRFTEGTLVIDVLDRNSEPVWRGVYRDDERNPSKLATQLPNNIRKLLSEFPPKKR